MMLKVKIKKLYCIYIVFILSIIIFYIIVDGSRLEVNPHDTDKDVTDIIITYLYFRLLYLLCNGVDF